MAVDVKLPDGGALYPSLIGCVRFQLLGLTRNVDEIVLEVGWADGEPSREIAGGDRSHWKPKCVFEFRFLGASDIHLDSVISKNEHSVREVRELIIPYSGKLIITDYYYRQHCNYDRFVDILVRDAADRVTSTYRSGGVRLTESFVLQRIEPQPDQIALFVNEWTARSERVAVELQGGLLYGAAARDDRQFQLLGLSQTVDEIVVEVGISKEPANSETPWKPLAAFELRFVGTGQVDIDRVVNDGGTVAREALSLTMSHFAELIVIDRLAKRIKTYSFAAARFTESLVSP
ncbi:MAG: hypothetical protein ACLQVD_00515 [Capsulimonadaceae bacterium]